MKIIQITDTHLMPPGVRLHTLDPGARLHRVLEHVRDTCADADLLVFTGDIANDGAEAAYLSLKEMLKDMPIPLRFLLGNHDRRASFLKVFPDTAVDDAGFVQSMLDTADGRDRLLFLDSLQEGETGGRYCQARLDWLAAALVDALDRQITLFVHHPPVPHGMRHFDKIGFHDAEAVMDLLSAHPGGVRHIFFGHIHIPLSGVTRDGIGFTAGRGCNHQFIQEFENPAPSWAAGPLNYNIITLRDEGVFVHGCDMFDVDPVAPSLACAGP
jgi:Icc protein